MNPTTCTVRFAHGRCGKPAVISNGQFAECAEHADGSPFSIATWGTKMTDPTAVKAGDHVVVATAGMARRVRVAEVFRTRCVVEFTVGRKGHERTARRTVQIADCKPAA